MILNFILGIVLGVLSGSGVGGGTLFILYLTFILGTPQLIAQGINLAYFISCSTPAVMFHFKHRLIHKKALVQCATAGILSSIIAGLLANNINTDILRRFFGIFLLYTGVKLLLTKNTNH